MGSHLWVKPVYNNSRRWLRLRNGVHFILMTTLFDLFIFWLFFKILYEWFTMPCLIEWLFELIKICLNDLVYYAAAVLGHYNFKPGLTSTGGFFFGKNILHFSAPFSAHYNKQTKKRLKMWYGEKYLCFLKFLKEKLLWFSYFDFCISVSNFAKLKYIQWIFQPSFGLTWFLYS